MENKIISSEMLDKVIKDKAVRTAVTRESHEWFFPVYLNRYMNYPTAKFQTELIKITERNDLNLAVIVAFRGSAKSTIMTMSYPIWAVLGRQQKKFVLILSKTQQQAKLHFTNLKKVLENETLLRSDLGPFKEEVDEWGSYTLVIPKYNARITAASSEQSIRGMRHGEHRPDLVICDDVEDLQSVKTREGRNKTYQWFTSEVLPIGDKGTKIILIGNLLHEDSLLMRVKEDIEEGRRAGIIRTYPIVNEEGVITWSSKYPTLKDIEEEKKRIGDRVAWEREFMLNIVPDADQVIDPKWIKFYEEMPRFDSSDYVGTYIGIDPAISEKDTADKTAMVVASVFGHGDDMKVFIHPNIVNEKLSFYHTKEQVLAMVKTVGKGSPVTLLVEDVAYQKALYEDLKRSNPLTEAFKVHGMDKRARLTIAAGPIEAGQVFFPRHGAKELIQQMIGFGVERYDDMADACAMVIRKAVEIREPTIPEIYTF